MNFFGLVFEDIRKEAQKLVDQLQITIFDLFLYFINNLVIFAKNSLHTFVAVTQIYEDPTALEDNEFEQRLFAY